MGLGTRGHIQGRILIEEADRLQGEAAVGHRHDGPVLWAGHMVVAKDVPQHHIDVVDGAIARCPLRQPLAVGVLVRVRASREVFIRRVGGNPEVMLQKARPPHDGGVGVGKGSHVFAGDELKAHGLP